MTPETEQLLYAGPDGEMIGLEEVQLLDDAPRERVERLEALLRADDRSLAAQATEVLAAWAIPSGLAAVEAAAKAGRQPGEALSPHRIHGYDETLDRYATAVQIGLLNGAPMDTARRIYRRMLAVYGPVKYESRLKYALLSWEGEPLAVETQEAILRTLRRGHPYMASQLLPVLARWDQPRYQAVAAAFDGSPAGTPDHRANIAQALGYIPSEAARAQLEALAHCGVDVVTDEVRKALARHRAWR